MNPFKRDVYAACKKQLEDKMNRLVDDLKELDVAMTNETKSSAGDKHETARAKMQFEQEKLKQQLHETQVMDQELLKINLNSPFSFVAFGALVETEKAMFFISIPLGQLQVATKKVFVISPVSPLALRMKGLAPLSNFEFNGVSYHVLSIY